MTPLTGCRWKAQALEYKEIYRRMSESPTPPAKVAQAPPGRAMEVLPATAAPRDQVYLTKNMATRVLVYELAACQRQLDVYKSTAAHLPQKVSSCTTLSCLFVAYVAM